MKTERLAGHHEARDALVLSVAGGDRDNAGREFDLDDFVLRPTVFRSGRIALAQLLVGGCAIVLASEYAQAQPGYVPPSKPLPKPVFNPSTRHTVSQPKYKPLSSTHSHKTHSAHHRGVR